ncbi:carbonic anhydrase [soil metagenome]
MNTDSINEGNAVFRAQGEYREAPMRPRRSMLIVGCADPRVDPEKVLGLRLGDAAVIRNIGGRVTAPTRATIAGLGQVGARSAEGAAPDEQPGEGATGLDVVVMHHTDCGILRLNRDPIALAGYLGTDDVQLAAMHVTDPYASVAYDVAELRRLELPGVRVWGLVYDVGTGLVELEVSAEEVRS